MATSSRKRFCKANQVRMPSPVMTILKRASDEYFKKWCDAEKRIKELELTIVELHSCADTSAWPIHDVVAKLAEAGDILLDEKDYDGHGYELISKAIFEAKNWLKHAKPPHAAAHSVLKPQDQL